MSIKISFFLFFFFPVRAMFGQCPGTAVGRNPAAATNVIIGGSHSPWSLCQQTYVSDDIYCYDKFNVSDSHVLYVYNWGLGLSGSSTVCGIKIRVEKSEPMGLGGVTDLSVQLYDGSALSPNNYASATPWPTVDTYITYGGNTDLWGWGSISAATANGVFFGLKMRAQTSIINDTAKIDHVELTGYADGLLPVTLISFDAIKDPEEHVVNFKWKCASEENNDFFSIERSKDLSSWKEVVRVKGAGNSSLETSYATSDAEPFPGNSYYRLMQTDFDGTTEQIDMISVRFRKSIDDIMTYPSIASDNINIRSKMDINRALIEFSNCSGQIVKKMYVNEANPDFELSINISELPPGFYFIRIVNGEMMYSGKVLKQ